MARSESGSAANITRYLKGIDFPAEKEELVQQARDNDADEEVINALEDLDDREYESMADVMRSISKAA